MWSRSWIHCSWQCGCLALVRKGCMLHSPILSYTGMCRCVCVSPAVPSDPHSCSGKTRRKLSHADCRLSLKFHELEQEEPKKKVDEHLHDKQVEHHTLPRTETGCQVFVCCWYFTRSFLRWDCSLPHSIPSTQESVFFNLKVKSWETLRCIFHIPLRFEMSRLQSALNFPTNSFVRIGLVEQQPALHAVRRQGSIKYSGSQAMEQCLS